MLRGPSQIRKKRARIARDATTDFRAGIVAAIFNHRNATSEKSSMFRGNWVEPNRAVSPTTMYPKPGMTMDGLRADFSV